MVGVFSRSWQITKLSFSVIKGDKELLAFPILSGIFSLIWIVLMLFPTLVSLIVGGVFNSDVFFYGSLFVIYFGVFFIATFFNVCVVYTTKKRFDGGNATFWESLKFALSKFYLIFLWSLIAASVGILLRVIESLGSRMGKGGQIAMSILSRILGAAWSITTLFVVPSLVYYNMTPVNAIKKSIETIKKTWGESLVRHFGLGFIQGLFLLLGFGVFFVLFLLGASLGVYGILSVAVLAIAYFLGVILIFSVANNVFNTALFVYADKGEVPTHFNKEVLSHAFENKK